MQTDQKVLFIITIVLQRIRINICIKDLPQNAVLGIFYAVKVCHYGRAYVISNLNYFLLYSLKSTQSEKANIQ